MILKFSVAGVLTVLFTTGFFGLDNLLAGKKFRDVSCALDARIPLRPRWIWVYLLYYPMCFLPFLFPGLLDDDAAYWRTVAGFSVQFLVAWVVFYVYPTRMARETVAGDGPSARAVRGLYAVDPGINILPSLHVANSVFVAALSTRYLPASCSAALILTSAAIAASTLYTKQHYLADVPTGVALGLAAYGLAFRAF